MNRAQALSRNVTLIQAMTALWVFTPVNPILVAYITGQGLSMTEFVGAEAFFALISIVLAVLGGGLADARGRKSLLLIGTALTICGAAILLLPMTFALFLLLNLFWGVGEGFVRGNLSATLYETLQEQNNLAAYDRLESRRTALMGLSLFVSSALGGYLYTLNPLYPILVTIASYIVILVLLALLVEPKRTKLDTTQGGLIGAFKAELVPFLQSHPMIIWHMLAFALVAGGVMLAFWYNQPYLKAAGFDYLMVGLVIGAYQIMGALLSLAAPKIAKKFGHFRVLAAIIALQILAYSIMAMLVTKWAALLVIIGGLAYYLGAPLIQIWVNTHTPSHIRGTVLSVLNQSHRIIFVALALPTGFLADHVGLTAAYGLIVAVMIGLAAYLKIQFRPVARGNY